LAYRILVVDDYLPWRRFVASVLLKQPEFQIIGEASDGLVAVEKAKELQPDLILLDIGLPQLNGIEAAQQIRELCPKSKILLATVDGSSTVAKTLLSASAHGYLVKSNAGSELLLAITDVLDGKQFVSPSVGLSGCDSKPEMDH
jgi:DNA-binding NarL/FixJ family response regulator